MYRQDYPAQYGMVLHTSPFLPISEDVERTVLLEARVVGPVDPQLHQEETRLSSPQDCNCNWLSILVLHHCPGLQYY
jgi:hypothetical protein